MEREKSSPISFANHTMVNFGVCIIIISVIGRLLGDTAQEMGGFMSLGSAGLSYPSILQLFLFSVTVTGVIHLFYAVVKKMMLLWQYTLIGLITFVIAVAFSFGFQWFPTDDQMAWISFLISFGVSMTGSILFMVLKIKLEDRKYGKQLSDYKAMQDKERGGTDD